MILERSLVIKISMTNVFIQNWVGKDASVISEINSSDLIFTIYFKGEVL